MKARALKTLKLAALALPFVLLAALAWALNTNSGLHFLLARADAAVGGGLSVGEVEGSLARGFVLEDVRLALGDARISITRLQAELRPTPLLIGKLTLVALELDGVRVTLPVDTDPTPFVLPARIKLPVHVAIERFAVRDLEVTVGATPPLALNEVSGRASADARGLRIEEARIAAQGLDAEGSLALALAQPYPTEGALRLTLEREGLPPIAGNAHLTGRLEALRVAAALDAPLAARADLALDDPFGAKRVTGRIETRDADLSPLFSSLDGWRFDADLALAGTLAAPQLSGRLDARRADLPALRADLGVRLDGKQLLLERLALTAAGRQTRIDARGRITLDGKDLPFVLDATATDPALPDLAFTLAGDLTRAEGRLTANGTLDAALVLEARAARAQLHGRIAGWALPGGITVSADPFDATLAQGRVEFAATGTAVRGKQRLAMDLLGHADAARVVLEQLELGLLAGRVTGSGSLELGKPQRLQAALRARDLDPRGLDPRFPGRLSARLELRGTLAQPELEIADLAGELRGRKVAGSARFGLGRSAELVLLGLDGVVVHALEFEAGKARVSAHSQPASAAFALAAPDLTDLLPSSKGALDVRAARATDGGLSASVTARGVLIGTARVAALDGSLQAPASGSVAGTLKAEGLSVGDIALDTLGVEVSGGRDALALTLEAGHAGTAFIATASGALQPRGFVGQLTRWDLSPVDAPRWTLAQAAALSAGRDGATLSEACVSDGKARACVAGGWHPLAPWQATVAVQHLGIRAFRNYLPRGLAYAGEIDLEARVAGNGPTLGVVRSELRLSSGSIEATVRRAKTTTATRLIEFNSGRVLLERDATHLGLRADLALSDGGKLDVVLEASGTGAFDSRPLTGRIVAQAEQFALLPVLLPELKQLSGKLDADIVVSGVIGAPRFAGHAAFRGGSASVPRIGLELSAFELELDGDGDALDLRGSARAGGTLEWQARLRHTDAGWTANGTLKGERFRAMNTPEARIIASPDLAVAYASDRVSVTGTVTVPEARIAPRSLMSAVQSSNDEVMLGDDEAPAVDTLMLEAKVHVALGDEVEFEGFGLKAGVEGGLTLTEKPGSLTLASGELALVDGKYEAYGQLLAIKRGKLLFSGGPVADPGLDVRAQRVIEHSGADDITVGIDVRGTLRRPELTLFSDPAMSSSEQLSYLVLGRSLNESTEGDQKLLGDAAQSMKVSGGELIAQQIGMRIGLDEVKVEDSDQEDAQLWLGTYLSPRLFVSYGIGLFEDFYSARVRYDISTKWTIEAESGRESSADFKYTIER